MRWTGSEPAISRTDREYTLLVVDDDRTIRELVCSVLESADYTVALAEDGAAALRLANASPPDLIISDVDMPTSGLDFVGALRRDSRLRNVPVIFLSSMDSTSDIVAGLTSGGDDYLTKPFHPAELLARVAAKLDRPPVPRDQLTTDPGTGLMTEGRFEEELEREHLRVRRGGQPGCVCQVAVLELPGLEARQGKTVAQHAFREVVSRILANGRPLDLVARSGRYELQVLMPDSDEETAKHQLEVLCREVSASPVALDGTSDLRVTPTLGIAALRKSISSRVAQQRAREALQFSTLQGDLRPVLWTEAIGRWSAAQAPKKPRRFRKFAGILRVSFQLFLMMMVGGVVPFLAYVLFDRLGHDVSFVMYLVVVSALCVTAALIWLEGAKSFGAPGPPVQPGEPYPAATAIIAAYLPNEASTILATIGTFLDLDYPAELEIILAYNSPSRLAVETELDALSRSCERFRAVRVEHSDSKAQNINTALPLTRGRFVGIFDADHHPRSDAFTRAWHWLSNGYDVVQGHCVVRNGGSSFIARMIAVEFEAIYAVSHPGRARLHGFGIFGGSNGFWRTDRLHQIRMRSSMLTEDIDSSMRVLAAGGRIASDPGLVSTELATTTIGQVWNQRMRWAQGWFQVSLAHYARAVQSPQLSLRQKLAFTHLLVWREVYPWISVQMFPLLAFWIVRDGGPQNIDWFVPIFVLTTLFTLSVGPGQTVLACLRADTQVGSHRLWFLGYLFFSSLFYTEFKNIIARLAQIKELMGERDWRVTPRDTGDSTTDDRLVA